MPSPSARTAATVNPAFRVSVRRPCRTSIRRESTGALDVTGSRHVPREADADEYLVIGRRWCRDLADLHDLWRSIGVVTSYFLVSLRMYASSLSFSYLTVFRNKLSAR